MAKTSYQSIFGPMATDQNGRSLPTAMSFSTQDATGTPQTSPLAYTSTTVFTLVVPDNATQLILSPTTDLRVSEEATVTRYDVVTAGAKEAFPVAFMQNVYVRRDSVDGSLRFRFVRV